MPSCFSGGRRFGQETEEGGDECKANQEGEEYVLVARCTHALPRTVTPFEELLRICQSEKESQEEKNGKEKGSSFPRRRLNG